MQAYLFVHFREKTTPDGEQVYFALSRDGFHWESVNNGAPVLWAYYGDKGVRDLTIIRCRDKNKFFIFATDLGVAYGLHNQYHQSWEEINRNGSKYLSCWESDNLVDWSEQKRIKIGDESFGCIWAPDIIYDKKAGNYVLHWSSAHKSNNYGDKGIYYSRTNDFTNFTKPEPLYRKPGSSIIDPAIYEENGMYYMFAKCGKDPKRIILLQSENITGPYRQMEMFDKCMEELEEGSYEGPTAVRMEDGRWGLFLDYYVKEKACQGYVPFLGDSLEKGHFTRADREFSFPYGFKHGTILTITTEEYERVRDYSWSDR